MTHVSVSAALWVVCPSWLPTAVTCDFSESRKGSCTEWTQTLHRSGCLVILPQARPWVNNDAQEQLWSKSAKSRKRPVLTPQSWLQLYLETLAIQWSTRACWIKWLKLLSISSISVFFCMRGPGKVAFDELILVPNHLKGPWLSNFFGFFNIFCFIFQPDERKKKKTTDA